MLSSLVYTPSSSSSVEDIFFSSLSLIFPDHIRDQHGDPGSYVIYKSQRFGDLDLKLTDPVGEDERRLFAHYLWNSGVLMAEYISGNGDGEKQLKERRRWDVKGEKVLELGAGTGLAGIISALSGAEEVVISDYPAPEILSNIKANVQKHVPENIKENVTIQGHEWGTVSDTFSRNYGHHFSRILSADCLWMSGEHHSLVESILHFLSHDAHARVWVIAGFHTGRAKLVSFLKVAAEAGLEAKEIWERDVDGYERAWLEERNGGIEDIAERKRWLVIAILQRHHASNHHK